MKKNKQPKRRVWFDMDTGIKIHKQVVKNSKDQILEELEGMENVPVVLRIK